MKIIADLELVGVKGDKVEDPSRSSGLVAELEPDALLNNDASVFETIVKSMKVLEEYSVKEDVSSEAIASAAALDSESTTISNNRK